MKNGKRYVSQLAPNKSYTTKDHATKVEPLTITTVAGTLDKTIASSQAAIILTTTSSRNKRPPLSKSLKKSRTIEKGRTDASSVAIEATPFMNACPAGDSSNGRWQRSLKLPLPPAQPK